MTLPVNNDWWLDFGNDQKRSGNMSYCARSLISRDIKGAAATSDSASGLPRVDRALWSSGLQRKTPSPAVAGKFSFSVDFLAEKYWKTHSTYLCIAKAEGSLVSTCKQDVCTLNPIQLQSSSMRRWVPTKSSPWSNGKLAVHTASPS